MSPQYYTSLLTFFLRFYVSLILYLGLSRSLQAKSFRFHGFLIPALESCVKHPQKSENFLWEPALELWRAIVENSPKCTPELSQLFPYLLTQFNEKWESAELGHGLGLIESYALLGRSDFMQVYSTPIASLLNSLFGEVNDEGQKYIADVIETMATLFPQQVPSLFSAVIRKVLQSIFQTIQSAKDSKLLFNNNINSPTAHTNNWDEFNHTPINPSTFSSNLILMFSNESVFVSYYHFIGRLFFLNFEGTKDMFESFNFSLQSPAFAIFVKFWLQMFKHAGEIYKKKLFVLAIANVFGQLSTYVMNDTFPFLLDPFIQAFGNVSIESEEGSEFPIIRPADFAEATQTPEGDRTERTRRLLVSASDPLYQCEFPSYVIPRLHQYCIVLGHERTQIALQHLPPQFQSLLQSK